MQNQGSTQLSGGDMAYKMRKLTENFLELFARRKNCVILYKIEFVPKEVRRMKRNRCKYCFCMFQSPDTRMVCDDCKKLDETLFDSVEAYLKKYPNSNALQISEGLEIPLYVVLRFIDEGRLQFSGGRFEKLK